MKKIVLIIMLLLFSKITKESNILHGTELVKKKENKSIPNYTKHFQTTVDFIKSQEGFKSKPYEDINNHITIGYGFIIHYLKPSERNHLTKRQATSIIVRKLKSNIKYAKDTYPGYNKFQYLAIAHLAYKKGFGNISKHKLHSMLKSRNINKETWLYYGKYEKTRNNYLENTKYELKLFTI